MTNIKRRLATILATDCVDFSKHMELDEVSTLSELNACRVVIDSNIKDFGGRIFHTAGDSVIAEFDSPVECVSAAVRFQEMLMERNKETTVEPKLLWRVGIHVDDIIIEGENVYGSGVNVAARLESHCQPGEILVSRVVREQVAKRVAFSIDASGTRNLKNIAPNFEVFSVMSADLNTGKVVSQQEIATEVNKAPPSNKTAIISELISNKKPKLAILPFKNLSKNEESHFLIDGVVEDLITEFSMMREFEILSRATISDFKVGFDDAIKFAVGHSVDFLINGSIRSSGSRIRLSIELMDAQSGNVVWSNKYDRVLDDVFEIQDEIVRKITIALLGEIQITSLQRSKRKPTENFSSYELLLRGKEQHHKYTKDANQLALEFFDKAIESDEGNAQAHAWKACTLGQGLIRKYIDDSAFDEKYQLLMHHLTMALDLNENDFECHRMLSAVYLSNHDYKKAEEHGRIAYRLNPNDPRVLSGTGEVLVRIGDEETGIALLEKALILDPIPMGQTTSDNRFKDLVLGYYCAENWDKCASYGIRVKDVDPRTWLLLNFSLLKGGVDLSAESSFRDSKSKFIGLDWEETIDRFHLPAEEKNKELNEFVSCLKEKYG